MSLFRRVLDPHDTMGRLAELQAASEERSRELAEFLDEVSAEIAKLTDLRSRAVAVADEYEREPRLIASAAVARMLREWVGEY